jgi:hypothetical protein
MIASIWNCTNGLSVSSVQDVASAVVEGLAGRMSWFDSCAATKACTSRHEIHG